MFASMYLEIKSELGMKIEKNKTYECCVNNLYSIFINKIKSHKNAEGLIENNYIGVYTGILI